MSKGIPAGAQLLTLPIDACVITAGYKNQLYAKQFGFGHFGVDMVSADGAKTVYALGDGEVIAAGLDGTAGDYSGLGWVTVIRYDNVYIPGQNRVADLIATTMHHVPGSLLVAAGDQVTAGSAIGDYGNTGGTKVNGGPMAPHLHLQFDTDVNYPLYCSGISGKGSRILRRGTSDSTVNPYHVLTRYETQAQTCRDRKDGWAEDWDKLPTYESIIGEPQGADREELERLTAQLEAAEARAGKAEATIANIKALIEKHN